MATETLDKVNTPSGEGAADGGAVSTTRGPGRLFEFIGEVRAELSKAQWPWDPNEKGFKRYKELADSTMVVLIAMLILGGYIAFFDFILINVVTFLTRS